MANYFTAATQQGMNAVEKMAMIAAQQEAVRREQERQQKLLDAQRGAQGTAMQGTFNSVGIQQNAPALWQGAKDLYNYGPSTAYGNMMGTPPAVPTVSQPANAATSWETSGTAPSFYNAPDVQTPYSAGSPFPTTAPAPPTMGPLASTTQAPLASTASAAPTASSAIPNASGTVYGGAQAATTGASAAQGASQALTGGAEATKAGVDLLSTVAPAQTGMLTGGVEGLTSATQAASGTGNAVSGLSSGLGAAGQIAGGLGAAAGLYSLATSKEARKMPGTWMSTLGGAMMMTGVGAPIGALFALGGALSNLFGWKL